jgi:8-oxo-dGTP pyrophosphatase MutT (NUDIX family)
MHRQLTVSVGMIQRGAELLLTRRINHKHPQWHQRWQFPGGKIQPEETPLEALHREVWEETSLTIRAPKLLGVHTQHWRLGDETQQTFVLLYHCLAGPEEVFLKDQENDAFLWAVPQEIVGMEKLLDGTVFMLKEFLLCKPPMKP